MTIKKIAINMMFSVPAALGAASAYAQSSVTLYGAIDNSIQYARSGGTGTARLDTSNVFPSNWGIQGSEDIGGGTHVIFRLENGFNGNNGTTAQTNKIFGREAWVGMDGAFGRFQVGLNNTPEMYGLIRFETGLLGHWDWGHAANNYDFFNSTKVANSVLYTSPNLSGLTFSAMYADTGSGGSTSPSTLGNVVSAGLYYTHGPFALEADYESQVYSTASTLTASSPTSTGNHDLFGMSYDFGIAKIDGIVVIHRGASAVQSINATTYADPNNIYYDISAQIPTGPSGAFMLSFGQYKKQGSSDGNSTSYGLRYDYRLSKVTGVYTGVAGVKNGREASFTVNGSQGGGIPVAPGKNELAFIAGIVHMF
ncbi:porin [Caballeronia sp. LjRoot34]|uniref:porin n=1 Tax=Caballeronia sp. LjRoot34 TaxID=3342325 RepID=UPI003ECEC444